MLIIRTEKYILKKEKLEFSFILFSIQNFRTKTHT